MDTYSTFPFTYRPISTGTGSSNRPSRLRCWLTVGASVVTLLVAAALGSAPTATEAGPRPVTAPIGSPTGTTVAEAPAPTAPLPRCELADAPAPASGGR